MLKHFKNMLFFFTFACIQKAMSERKTIIIIDDSSTNVILLDNLLSHKGYHTLSASSVKEALALLERSKPDLIILDLLMPFVDGFEFLNIIKNDTKTKDIPVIIVSAVNDNQEVERAKSYGVLEFVSKPINIKQFSSYIDSIFEGK